MGQTFEKFPYALYAHDVKFQVAYRPGGRFDEQKRYFSGKHKLYGYKIDCSVVPPGVAVHVSKHYTGSISDLSIVLDNMEIHKQMLKKTEEERASADYGELHDKFRNEWALLVDKGYEGLSQRLRAIQPKKKPR